LSARELVRETSYDLTELSDKQLGKKREPFDLALLPNFYKQTGTELKKLLAHTEKDAYFTMELLFHLSIIPLTKQLTNIAGNLWCKSLQNARAERNEMLLLHEFGEKGYICPDKPYNKRGDDEPSMGKKRGKAKYEGGLVLEPDPGLYDKIVLLLDFNSLYPSIIQEYNICFTTVERRDTQNFDGSVLKDPNMMPG
jgi:DNA polymerase alpha subunit A